MNIRMSQNIKVGDKVVSVNAKFAKPMLRRCVMVPAEGKTYTVRWTNGVMILLKEVKNHLTTMHGALTEPAFDIRRFSLAAPEKTDHEVSATNKVTPNVNTTMKLIDDLLSGTGVYRKN